MPIVDVLALKIGVELLWMPNYRSLFHGLSACGFGAGAIIMTPIQTGLINPSNINPDNKTFLFTNEKLLNRVPISILIIGIILAVLQTLGCCCLKFPDEYIIGLKDIKNDQYLMITGTLSSAAKMLGQLMWSQLADRIPYRWHIMIPPSKCFAK
ncbi:hypothetical protein ACTXT7_007367 [Hymenolepis weldensis]